MTQMEQGTHESHRAFMRRAFYQYQQEEIHIRGGYVEFSGFIQCLAMLVGGWIARWEGLAGWIANVGWVDSQATWSGWLDSQKSFHGWIAISKPVLCGVLAGWIATK